MPGTRIGGLKACQTNKERYGQDFYQKIGEKGGKLSTGGAFSKNRELARLAGMLGGTRSKRGGNKELTPEQIAKIEWAEARIKELKENA